MSALHGKPDLTTPTEDADKVPLFRSLLGVWELLSLSQLVSYVLSKIPIAMGTWTPTMTADVNVDAVTSPTGIYLRVGTVVVAVLFCSVDATAAGFAQVRASLPVATNMTTTSQMIGVANGPNWSNGRIQGDPTNDEAAIIAVAASTSSQFLSATFTYRVL